MFRHKAMIISMFIFSKNKWASLQVLCLFRRMIYPLVGCIRLVTHRAHGGPRVTPMIVAQLPGLNSLGILMVRTDYAPWRLNPPHTHPKATEILIVLEGSLHFGFVTSNLDNSHITKVLQKGNVFVFPGRTCSLPTQPWKHKYWAVNPSVKPLQVLFLDQTRHCKWSSCQGIPGGQERCGSAPSQLLEQQFVWLCFRKFSVPINICVLVYLTFFIGEICLFPHFYKWFALSTLTV